MSINPEEELQEENMSINPQKELQEQENFYQFPPTQQQDHSTQSQNNLDDLKNKKKFQDEVSDEQNRSTEMNVGSENNKIVNYLKVPDEDDNRYWNSEDDLFYKLIKIDDKECVTQNQNYQGMTDENYSSSLCYRNFMIESGALEQTPNMSHQYQSQDQQQQNGLIQNDQISNQQFVQKSKRQIENKQIVESMEQENQISNVPVTQNINHQQQQKPQQKQSLQNNELQMVDQQNERMYPGEDSIRPNKTAGNQNKQKRNYMNQSRQNRTSPITKNVPKSLGKGFKKFLLANKLQFKVSHENQSNISQQYQSDDQLLNDFVGQSELFQENYQMEESKESQIINVPVTQQINHQQQQQPKQEQSQQSRPRNYTRPKKNPITKNFPKCLGQYLKKFLEQYPQLQSLKECDDFLKISNQGYNVNSFNNLIKNQKLKKMLTFYLEYEFIYDLAKSQTVNPQYYIPIMKTYLQQIPQGKIRVQITQNNKRN